MLAFSGPARARPQRPWSKLARGVASLILASWATGCASLPSLPPRPTSQAYAEPDTTPLGRITQAQRARAGARSDSAFALLDSVEAAYTSRLALIESARHSLDLQYYAIHADSSTEVLLQRIREAARRGVRVRLLLDDFNSVGDDAQVLRLAFEPGIEIRLFNPLPGTRGSLVARVLGSLHDIPRMQRRMHNKLFIADNAWGITGGRNLGDAYFGGDEDSRFVDLDVLATGQIVRAMSTSFDRFWNDQLAYPVQALLSPEALERLRAPVRPDSEPLAASATPSAASAAPVLPDLHPADVAQARRRPMDLRQVRLTWAPSALLVDQPGKVAGDEEEPGETVIEGLLALMEQARHEVLVISPYFVPGQHMKATFARLRERGVTIRVLTNSLASNDAPAAHAGYARHRKELLALGLQLHEMHADPATAEGLEVRREREKRSGLSGALGSAGGGSKSAASRASLHSKAVIIDRRLAIIGSMNLDLRSQLQNSEVGLVIRSPALAKDAARLIEDSVARGAYRVELDGTRLRWRAPPGAPFGDSDREPDAPLRLRLLVRLIAPFAPDEML